jgi:hypothetical protein
MKDTEKGMTWSGYVTVAAVVVQLNDQTQALQRGAIKVFSGPALMTMSARNVTAGPLYVPRPYERDCCDVSSRNTFGIPSPPQSSPDNDTRAWPHCCRYGPLSLLAKHNQYRLSVACSHRDLCPSAALARRHDDVSLSILSWVAVLYPRYYRETSIKTVLTGLFLPFFSCLAPCSLSTTGGLS